MSNEDVGITAVKELSGLSTSIIMGLTNEVHRLINMHDSLLNLVREGNDLCIQLSREVKALSQEITKMRSLLHDPTVDALTGPLLELQTENKRRRENSARFRNLGG